MQPLRLSYLACLAAVILSAACRRAPAPATQELILATTTSAQDSGILDSLVPAFEARSGIRVKVIAVGTGAALDLAVRGNADAVLVHAPTQEAPLVARGDLAGGRRIMHNDFLIVGPPADPARARSAGGLDSALRRIARTGPFVSRGDGRHAETRELELAGWAAAGTAVRGREQTGQGMGATLPGGRCPCRVYAHRPQHLARVPAAASAVPLAEHIRAC